jgi:competence ComEA-like helix-hairpin-helix protein
MIAALIRALVQSETQLAPLEHSRFRVDVNHASLAELMALPNMGPATASKVVDYRRQNGPFENVEQLLRVPGIGPATLKSLRPLLLIVPSEATDDSLVTK